MTLLGGTDLPVDLPILALIVEIKYCHSWPLDDSTVGGRIDLPVDLLILALIVEIQYCHSWPLDDSTGEWGRSAS